MQPVRRAQPFPGSISTRQTMSGRGCGELTSSCVSQDLLRQFFRGTRFRSSAIIEITYSFDMLKLQTCLRLQTKYVEWREMRSTAWWDSKRSSARFPSRIGDGANHRARRCAQRATIIFGEIEKAYKNWLFSMRETIDLRVARTYHRRARTSLGQAQCKICAAERSAYRFAIETLGKFPIGIPSVGFIRRLLTCLHRETKIFSPVARELAP